MALWVAFYQPDTVFFNSGRNDPWDWSYSYDRYTTLVNTIFALRPQATVYWSNVFLPLDQGPWEETHCQVQNQAVMQVAKEQRALGRNVWVIDAYSELKGRPDIFADAVHLNDLGYGLWKDAIFRAVRRTPQLAHKR